MRVGVLKIDFCPLAEDFPIAIITGLTYEEENSVVIDFRLRPPFGSMADLSIFKILDHPITGGIPAPLSAIERSMETLVREMDEAGVQQGVVMGRQASAFHGSVPNAEILQLVTAYPGRFIPFAGVNPLDMRRAMQEIDHAVGAWGFKGVAVDPGWLDPPLMADDGRLYPIYTECERSHIPIAITTSVFVGPDIRYSRPDAIQRVAQTFPELSVIIPHAAWPWVTQMLGVALVCPNVWISPDLYGNIPHMPAAEQFWDTAPYYLADRLLFGSAYPIRSVIQSVQDFERLPIDPRLQTKILYENAASLLALERH